MFIRGCEMFIRGGVMSMRRTLMSAGRTPTPIDERGCIGRTPDDAGSVRVGWLRTLDGTLRTPDGVERPRAPSLSRVAPRASPFEAGRAPLEAGRAPLETGRAPLEAGRAAVEDRPEREESPADWSRPLDRAGWLARWLVRPGEASDGDAARIPPPSERPEPRPRASSSAA